MIYLLDINVLMGLALTEHELNRRAVSWMAGLDREADRLATCTITELGLVRIVPQMARGMTTVAEAQLILKQVKTASTIPFAFLGDDLGADRLPKWVKMPAQTTDGHLLELARAHKAVFATCDEHIPGAFVLPHL